MTRALFSSCVYVLKYLIDFYLKEYKSGSFFLILTNHYLVPQLVMKFNAKYSIDPFKRKIKIYHLMNQFSFI